MRKAIAAVVLLAGCPVEGDGKLVTDARTVASFAAIEVFGEFTVEVEVRPELGAPDTIALEVEGESNVMDRLFTVVHGDGVLSIAVDPNLQTEPTLAPTVRLAVPALRRVFAADRATVTITGEELDDTIAVTTVEGSEVSLTLADRITADITASGTSRVTLAGAGPLVIVDAADSAQVDASGFVAGSARVTVRAPTAAVTVCTAGEALQTAGEVGQVTVRCAE